MTCHFEVYFYICTDFHALFQFYYKLQFSFKASDPSEIFRTHIADISDAFATNLDQVTNSLFAKKLIVHQVYQNILTTEGVSSYRKASRLVDELYNQLKAHSEPKLNLSAICDVMLKQDDQRLKKIANQMQNIL